MINSIYKKGEKSKVRNCRVVIVMDIACTIYASILHKKLRGLRTGRGIIGAVCILNYVLSKEISKKRGTKFYFLHKPQGGI